MTAMTAAAHTALTGFLVILLALAIVALIMTRIWRRR